MTVPQTLFILALGTAVLMLILELIRRNLLREKYAILWLVVAAGILSVPPLFPAYVALGRFVGIESSTSFFLFMAIVGLVLLGLQFSLALSMAHYQPGMSFVKQA